jgi:hypothetical protein
MASARQQCGRRKEYTTDKELRRCGNVPDYGTPVPAVG